MAALFAKFNCTYCQEDITGLRVKCVECTNFDLCLHCFSAGAEVGPHKSDHSFQFVNSGAVGLTFGKNGWTAKEELHLLDAVEDYGFGNWEDISKHVESRSSDEARDQYTSRYLEGTIGRLTWPPALNLRPDLAEAFSLDAGPLSPSATGRLPPLDVSAEEAKQLVYMPLRDDFDTEYDNAAEKILSPFCISGRENDDLDIALVLSQVDVYAQALRERARRKRVARDYQLVSNFFNSSRKEKVNQKKKLSKEEKELHDGMRVFCQFHTATEHEQFLANMQREQELKIRLSELARYRSHGITRHEECAHFEQELLGHQPQPVGSSGASTIHPAFHPQVSTYLRKRERGADPVWCSTERRCIFASLGGPSTGRAAGGGGAAGGGQGGTMGNSAVDSASSSAKLLSKQETALCSALALTPSEYLALKAAIIKESEVGDLGMECGVERSVEMFLTNHHWLPG